MPLEADFVAPLRLHEYLVAAHWRDQKLLGPDPGLRLNYRIWRFVKSALPHLPWADDVCFIQAQGYWILDNWHLYELTGEERFREIARACSDAVIGLQRPDGGWDYPVRAWQGRTATVEGIWGAIGLLASFRQTGEARYLDAALTWHRYLEDQIGYLEEGEQLAVNYFAQDRRARVPNNSALLLRLLADLTETTGDAVYLERCPGLIAFMRAVQMPTGEIPYAVSGLESWERLHFQCYQYNAFQALHLMHYYERTSDSAALPIIEGVLGYLSGGLAEDGHAYYDCSHPRRAVIYHTSALAAAFDQATRMGLGDYAALADRALAYVLRAQRPDGGFPHSRRDYGFLRDDRSYPRYLAMILHHLLSIMAPQSVAGGPAQAGHRGAQAVAGSGAEAGL